jgi:hypoxanthine phosphoribosyltransferase
MKKSATTKPRKKSSRPLPALPGARLKLLVSEKDIRKRVRELARQINRDYAGKTLYVVGVLEDSFVFMADLVRALTMPVVCSFIRAQVRDSDCGTVPIREITYITPVDIPGKELLLVGGVLQTGITLDHLCRTFLAQQPTSLRTVALIDKAEERKVDLPVDYIAFQFSHRFVVGYGLGHQNQFRNLPFLAKVAE